MHLMISSVCKMHFSFSTKDKVHSVVIRVPIFSFDLMSDGGRNFFYLTTDLT